MKLLHSLPLLLALAISIATTTSHASLLDDALSEATSLEDLDILHLLRPRPRLSATNCLSWRLGVEAHNAIDWETVPKACGDYVGNYMFGAQYRADSKFVCVQAYYYAKSLAIPRDGRTIWIFDIGETTLSSLPYYAQHGFGTEPYNASAFYEWVRKGEAPVLPETLKLYGKIVNLGIKPVFLSGRRENQREVTEANLKKAGYHTWERVILRGQTQLRMNALAFKSYERSRLVESGYRIAGNIGDQWSDIMGIHKGDRTFKLPDPMYYIS